MTDRDERNDDRAGAPERVAVYSRPDTPPGPTSTTGTTGVAKPVKGNPISAGTVSARWLIPAAVVLLVILAFLLWVL